MVPVAPGLLSTTTVVFSDSCILAPTVRAIMSVEPPGGNGTSSVIGFSGQAAAAGAATTAASSSVARPRPSRRVPTRSGRPTRA